MKMEVFFRIDPQYSQPIVAEQNYFSHITRLSTPDAFAEKSNFSRINVRFTAIVPVPGGGLSHFERYQ